MNTTLKCTLMLLIMCIALPLAAQRKKTLTFELGINHSVDLGERANDLDEASIYFQMSYMLKKCPISIDFSADLNRFTYTQEVEKRYYDMGGALNPTSETWYYEANEMNLMPSINYHFFQNKKVDAYAGWGLGLSMNNVGAGIFNEGTRYYIKNMPRVGVLLFNHLHLSFDYSLYHKNMNRGRYSIGYVF